MEGLTDFYIRDLLTQRGGFDFVVSEFLRISENIPPKSVFLKHFPELISQSKTFAQTPVQLQLLGGDESKLALTAQKAVDLGALAIDLNFGCPSKTVNKNDGGASLLKFPERIKKIASSVRSILPQSIPVSAKLRLGWEDPKDIYKNASAAIEGGASWLTLHARTKVQGYQPPVFWKFIGDIQKWNAIPIIANGDIWTVENFLKCRDETHCEHFMIGRGTIADPTLPQKIASILKNEKTLPETPWNLNNWIEFFQQYAQITDGKISDSYLLCRMKQFISLSQTKNQLAWFNDFKKLPSSLPKEELFHKTLNELPFKQYLQ